MVKNLLILLFLVRLVQPTHPSPISCGASSCKVCCVLSCRVTRTHTDPYAFNYTDITEVPKQHLVKLFLRHKFTKRINKICHVEIFIRDIFL